MGALETSASLFRGLHIAAGFAALLCFWVPLVVTKGNRTHRTVGRVYVWAMFVAAATAIVLVPIRMSQRPVDRWGFTLFLAYIAVLAFASAFYGVRVLKQKKRTGPHTALVDFVPPVVLAVAAVGLFAFGMTAGFQLGLFFGPVGLLVAIPQIRNLRATPEGKQWWLLSHLSSMLVASITTVTAFFVVNAGHFFPTYKMVAWVAPTIIGVPLISYWRRRYRAQMSR
jgi:uncharacterized membrane protein